MNRQLQNILVGLCGLVALLAVTTTATAQVLLIMEIVVQEGDVIEDVGAVTRIDNLAVNAEGDWLVEADTDHSDTDRDQVLIRNGALYLREGDPLPAPEGAAIGSFDSVNLSDMGNSGWNLFLDGVDPNDSGIFFDTTLVIQEGDVTTAPEFGPGTVFLGFFDVKINQSLQLMSILTVEDLLIPSTVDQALMRFQLGPGGTLLAENALFKEGDILPGQVEAIATFGTGPHQTSFNDAGEVLYFADLDGSTATDGVIYHDLALLAQEGSPSPIPDRNYQSLSGRGLDLDNVGDHVFKADLDGDTTDDYVIIKNGAVFAQEGGSIPAIGPYVFTGFGLASGPVLVGDNGKVLWYGEWNDPNSDVNSGLFVDDELLVQEGVTEIGGQVVDTIMNGQDAFAMSDDGRWAIVEMDFVGGLNSAVLIELYAPTPVAEGPGIQLPRASLLAAPNPSPGQTVIGFALPASGTAEVTVFDLQGRLVATLGSGSWSAGSHELPWDGRDRNGRPVPAGTYFARLRTADEQVVQRLAVIR